MKTIIRLCVFWLILVSLVGCGASSDNASNTQYTGGDTSEVTLTELEITGLTLDESFQPSKTLYSSTVASDVDSFTLTPSIDLNSEMLILLNNKRVNPGELASVPLEPGTNNISLLLTNGTESKEYTFVVTRALPNSSTSTLGTNADLSGIGLTEGTLTPAFDASILNYSVNVGYEISNIALTASLVDQKATLKVNNTVVASGSMSDGIALSEGDNFISVVVTAEDAVTTKTYQLTISRDTAPVQVINPPPATTLSNNANLSGLTISSGTLSPAFDSAVPSYSVNVGNEITTMSLTPTVADSAATITVNNVAVNSGAATTAAALVVGSNSFSIKVTAEDGSLKYYSVNVERAASSNADLSSLSLSSGSLSPAFTPGTTSYSVAVGNSVTDMSITPLVADSTASLTVNGSAIDSGVASNAISLNVGNNTITISVTAEDSSVQNYILDVSRAASSNANLSALGLSSGALAQTFSSGVTGYTQTVSYGVSSLTVTPTVEDNTASITVNGISVASGSASSSIALTVGLNAVTTVVTAQDGTTKTYTVNITRQANSFLADLQVHSGSLDQVFQSNLTTYTSSLGFLSKSLRFTVTTDDPAASVTINGISVTSGERTGLFALNEGVNNFDIVVTAVDSGTTTYNVSITRGNAASFAQSMYAKGSRIDVSNNFGLAVDIYGNTMVVGAPYEDSAYTGIIQSGSIPADDCGAGDTFCEANSGAVFVFVVDNAGTWTQEAYIKASNTGMADFFGSSVSLSGDTLVVGAPGESSNSTAINVGETDNSASSAGAVYVFTRTGSVWTQEAYIKASNAEGNDGFGSDVAIDGDLLVASSPYENGSSTGIDGADNNLASWAGAVYAFTRTAGVWMQDAYIKPAVVSGSENFGTSVSLDNNSLVVGSPNESSSSTGVNGNDSGTGALMSGAAYVFVRDVAGTWSQQAFLKSSNSVASDTFGTDVAISGDTIAVGAPMEDSGAIGIDGNQVDDCATIAVNCASNSGAVYVFTRSGVNWTQQAYIKSFNSGANDQFGSVLDVHNDTLVVGTTQEDGPGSGVNTGQEASDGESRAGAAYVFTRTAGLWAQDFYVKAGVSEIDDYFGASIAIQGDMMAVGGIGEDGGYAGINANQYSNGVTDSGAGYAFK